MIHILRIGGKRFGKGKDKMHGNDKQIDGWEQTFIQSLVDKLCSDEIYPYMF